MGRRVAAVLGSAALAALLPAPQGCSDNGGDASGPSDCIAAGGQCVIGSDLNCAKRGHQDCDPNHTPAGFFCCLAPAAAEDASVSAGALCAAAGGQCLVGGVCASVTTDQSCGPGADCCLDVTCAPDVHYDIPPKGSSYDQSCTTDSDCLAVGFGDACLVCEIGCVANAAISKSAEAQYRSDVAKTPANGVDCGCPEELPGGPCCIGGMCQFGSQCLAADAAADTGATDAAEGDAADAAADGGPLDAGGG
jgi:hypothetical protein